MTSSAAFSAVVWTASAVFGSVGVALMTHPNAAVIQRFYESFQRRDPEGMVACYHPEIVFEDPAFGELHGGRARAMWRMLCERGKDLEVTFRDVRAADTDGSAHWEAHYTFSVTKRRVHNIIDATFRFKDGKIIDHRDQFDFKRWARAALGPTGILIGRLGPLRRAFQKKANKGLDEFIGSRGDAATKIA